MDILSSLKLFGLNKYEALAYIQIVKSGVATAKEVSKGSGVPYSRVYDVLDSLEKKGWVLVETSKPQRFRAKKIDIILDEKKNEVIEELEEARKELIEELLPYFHEDIRKVGVWTIRGIRAIHSKVIEMIGSSRESLDIVVPFLPEGFEEEIREGINTIRKKLEEGVKLRLIAGQNIVERLGAPEKGCEVRVSGERMGWVIIADLKEVLYGVFSPPGNEVGIWSNEPEMVRISGIMFNYLWEGSRQLETGE